MVGVRAAERNPALALLPLPACKGSDIALRFVPVGFVAHLVPSTTKPPMSNTRKGRRRMTPTKHGNNRLGRRLPHPPGPSPFHQGDTERVGALRGASHPMPVFGKAACSQDTAKNVCVHRPPSRRMLSSVIVEQGWLGACIAGREDAAAKWCMSPVIRAGRLLLAEVCRPSRVRQ